MKVEKTDDGYRVTNEEVQKVSRILGYVGLAMLATRLFRVLFWPPVGNK